MFIIYDGRNEFYQWDLGQKLIVSDPTVTEVHFCNMTEDCALVCEVYEEGGQRLVNVPNILLQNNYPIRVYALCECATKTTQTISVRPRSKPSDYVYTETEVRNWETFTKRLDELELGARGIIEVDELPTENINSALLHRTPEGIFWYDGEWHKIADESVLELAIKAKQDTLSFDGEYNAQTNKVATVKTVVDKVAEIVSDAPKDFDTLKEFSDWIATHGGDAAKMNSAILKNTEDISKNAQAIAEIEKDVELAHDYSQLALQNVNSVVEYASEAKVMATEAKQLVESEVVRATEAESKLQKSIEDTAKQIEENILPHIVNADYDENDPTSKAYILNRPFYDTRETDENGEEIGELKTLDNKYLDLPNNPDFKLKQDNLEFDGVYNPETNKAATVQTIINKVAELIAGAPEDFNTLKELADWLTTHGAEAAEMNSAIKQNTDDIAEISEGLTNYVKYTDEPGNALAGGKPGPIALNYATSCGLRIEGSAGKRYLMVYGGNDTDVLRRNGACVLTLANMDSRVKAVLTGHREKNVNGTWVKSYGNQTTMSTDEQKSAKNWLGVKDHNIDDGVFNNYYDGTRGLAYEIYEAEDNPDVAFMVCEGRGNAMTSHIEIGSTIFDEPVTGIADRAFYGDAIMRRLVIPDTVTSIGEDAFHSCINLKKAIIGNSVTELSEGMFMNCISLKSVVIPETVTHICEYAFDECTSLTDVYFRGTEDEWNAIVIANYNDVIVDDADIHFNYRGD